MILRPYQEAAIQAIRDSMRVRNKRVMLMLPTGAGKTATALSIINMARENGKRIAFVVNRVELVKQTSAVFNQAQLFHGVIQGSNTFCFHADIVVASIQTLARRPALDFDLIIIDEAHGSAGSSHYRDFMIRNKNTPIIGLSATPFAKGLGKHYDELGGALWQDLIVGETIAGLIEGGFLVPADVYAPSKPDMSHAKLRKNTFGDMDYSDEDAGKAADTPKLIGDIYANWKRLSDGKSTVVFASTIEHSRHIVEEFRANGVSAEHIDYKSDGDERAAILKRVASGETLILSNVALLAEGWDSPRVETIILARPTKSLARYIQMVGRVLRPYEGKESALILDHAGVTETLGFHDEVRDMTLDDGKPKTAAKKPEKEKPLPKPCPACSYMRQIGDRLCPKCGYVFYKKNAIEVEEGELKKIERKSKDKPKVQRDDKQEYYSWLISERRERGYQSGWIAHKYKHRFGVWPRGLMDWDYPEYTRMKKLKSALAEVMPA